MTFGKLNIDVCVLHETVLYALSFRVHCIGFDHNTDEDTFAVLACESFYVSVENVLFSAIFHKCCIVLWLTLCPDERVHAVPNSMVLESLFHTPHTHILHF